MSKPFQEDDKCIFMGGLRRDLVVGKLKGHLKYLFKIIGIDVKKNQMVIINNPRVDYCYGFVDLNDVEAVSFVLHHLSTQAALDNVKFDFTLIQDPSKRLKFDHKRPSKQPFIDKEHELDTSWAPIDRLSFSSPLHRNKGQEEIDVLSKSSLPSNEDSETTLPTIEESQQTDELSKSQSDKSIQNDITPTVIVEEPDVLPDRYYKYNEILDDESKPVFKQEAFVVKDNKDVLQENVGKYVCACLNTTGGTLYVGVNEDGHVIGVPIDQQEEDKHRLSIDSAIESINPLVLPNMYEVDFVHVMDENGLFGSNLKVIKMKVQGTQSADDLYAFRGDAYTCQDGCVQMLKVRAIQEWERQRNKAGGDEEILQKLAEHSKQVQQLKDQVTHLETIIPQQKSKTCVII